MLGSSHGVSISQCSTPDQPGRDLSPGPRGGVLGVPFSLSPCISHAACPLDRHRALHLLGSSVFTGEGVGRLLLHFVSHWLKLIYRSFQRPRYTHTSLAQACLSRVCSACPRDLMYANRRRHMVLAQKPLRSEYLVEIQQPVYSCEQGAQSQGATEPFHLHLVNSTLLDCVAGGDGLSF